MQVQSGLGRFHPSISQGDAETISTAVRLTKGRIEKIELADSTVWLKRQGTEKPIWWGKLQHALSKLLPYPFMRPSRILDAEGMNRREIDAIEAFAEKGLVVPIIIYRAPKLLVVRDVGPSIAERIWALREQDRAQHEALIVQAVEALGEVHAAGLCHGRPHLRDFFLRDSRIGFLDFEERPQDEMPLATAQARDLWLLLLTTSTISIDVQNTYPKAFEKWRSRAPQATQDELRQMIAVLGRFLPIVRLIGRVRMGSDLRRFILATEFLKTALETDAAFHHAGKAGKDDRT